MKLRSLLVCVLFIVGTAGQVYAQGGGSGTITGTVTDSTAKVIVGAKVTVTNTATSVNDVVESNGDGNYTVPYLRPGTYRVAVEFAGFQKSVVDNINLAVDQVVRANAVMQTGVVTETVTVSANAVTLDTDTAAISQTIGTTQVDNLPLQDRNFVSFLMLGAGAVTTNGEQATFRAGKGDAISINGARPTSNNYTLDGLLNTDTALNTPAVILSQDAIQEFKEQSSNYSAEYGFSANQVNIVSKSGGNEVHGSVFWFGRNDFLDAQRPLAPSAGKLRQNQYGFVASGPVYIPGVYDGRNKTFWLANFEGTRRIDANSVTGIVAPLAMMNGNFSGSGLPAYGSAACTTALAANQPCMPIDPTTGAPFPGNIIPSARFSRLATAALAQNIFPAPGPIIGGNNFNQNFDSKLNQHQQTYKGDQDFGRYGKVFGRYTVANYVSTTAGASVSLPAGEEFFTEHEKSWTVGHTLNIGNSLVNQLRYGQLSAIADQCEQPVAQSVITAIGFTGTFANLPDCYRSFPYFTIEQLAAYGGFLNGQTTSDIPTREVADSLTFIHGRHTMTMGADYRHWVQKRNLANDLNGQLGFTNALILQNGSSNGFIPGGVKGCTTPACGTGNAVADFLLGYYSNAGTFLPGPFSKASAPGNLNQYHFTYFAPFFQDDWKVNSRLTVNLGLRWDFRTVPFEQNNKMGWLDVTNPLGGLCIADPTLTQDGIAPAGQTVYRYCGRRNPADGSKKPFAPRFGFAFRPFSGDKTVIRGGYGIFFDSSEGREIDDSGDIYPYEVRTALNPTSQPVASAPKLTNQIFVPTTAIAAVDPSLITFTAVIISETPRNPYVQQWDLSVQHQVTRNTTVELSYLGTRGVHLLARNNIAQAFAPDTVCAPNPTLATCPVAARRPYSNFTGFYIDSRWVGKSTYESGTAKIEHRSGALTMQASYTWSKSLDDKSAAAGIGTAGGGFQGFTDNHRPELDYGPSDFDVKSRFVSNFVYQLPVGKGKRYLGSANGLVDAAIGGWQLGSIITIQKGFPFSVVPPNDPLMDYPFGASQNRADRVPGVSPTSGFTKSLNEWFNTAAFVAPAPGTIGNSGRNSLRGPGLNRWDMSLAKNFAVNERMHIQLRFDALNLFNHPYWTPPGNNIQPPGPNSTYGKIGGSQANSQRILQLGAKIQF